MHIIEAREHIVDLKIVPAKFSTGLMVELDSDSEPAQMLRGKQIAEIVRLALQREGMNCELEIQGAHEFFLKPVDANPGFDSEKMLGVADTTLRHLHDHLENHTKQALDQFESHFRELAQQQQQEPPQDELAEKRDRLISSIKTKIFNFNNISPVKVPESEAETLAALALDHFNENGALDRKALSDGIYLHLMTKTAPNYNAAKYLAGEVMDAIRPHLGLRNGRGR